MSSNYQDIDIQTEKDIVTARSHARRVAKKLEFSTVDQTRIATAVSEIARNALVHGGGGTMKINSLDQEVGLQVTIVDQGQGIENIERAMKDGYSTRNSLGLGLGGAKRLMDEFEIQSQPGEGTKVIMTKYNSRRR
ncbi:MAG: anti-sigma regulatory factor [Thermoproteota archaeon]